MLESVAPVIRHRSIEKRLVDIIVSSGYSVSLREAHVAEMSPGLLQCCLTIEIRLFDVLFVRNGSLLFEGGCRRLGCMRRDSLWLEGAILVDVFSEVKSEQNNQIDLLRRLVPEYVSELM